MAELNSIKVVEVCKVAPLPTPSSLPPPPISATSQPPLPPLLAPPSSLPLTLFDFLWLRFAPVERLFFFEIPSTNFTNNPFFFHSTLIPKLKASLSLTLQHFLPLAGNLTWPQHSPKPILTYLPHDAVSLTIAEYDDHHLADHNYFTHLASSTNFDIKAKEYHPLIPQLHMSHEKSAAMALQVTIFPNQGFSIGTSMHHAIFDGKTSTMFVKSWAHICNKLGDHEHYCHNNIQLPVHLKPFFDRTVIKDPIGLEAIYSDQFLNMDRPNNRSLMFSKFKPQTHDSVRGTFVFTRARIEALKKLVKEKARLTQQQHEHHQPVHLSTFCVSCAYTWVCIIKAEEIKSEKSFFGFTVDSRSRLDPSVPENYVGNCLTVRVAVADTNALLGEEGLLSAIRAISEATKSLDDGVLKGAEHWIPSLYSVGSDARLFSVAGSPRFEIYETDFGWGRPKKVEIVSIERTGAMSVSECKDGGGGVDVGLVLRKHHMEAFDFLFSQGVGNI